MIERINFKAEEGQIFELNGISEPLYIWHGGKLTEITPAEYNLCTLIVSTERWSVIQEKRFRDNYYDVV